ncbi:hypothetical protein [Streptomyces hesseae]|uniref:DUF397 domain-containing protein n=1 Tax=Streptomyces hesseae TaxID=3075519 RepID=A0ABU2SN27_9ACTN|nr:hypothetical protein [Streptomyces sp. DSM 40473]MDT0449465.1 hypothetical protein [Streptomyces sp. DSM 40473]
MSRHALTAGVTGEPIARHPGRAVVHTADALDALPRADLYPRAACYDGRRKRPGDAGVRPGSASGGQAFDFDEPSAGEVFDLLDSEWGLS